MEDLVKVLIEKNKTISSMESCTGGGFANAITNIEGASSILKFAAVTYSNEFKIKMGVSSDVIDTYSVYSENTAKEMAKCISNFTGSDYGVGITGKLNREDKNNQYGQNNKVYICIYEKNNDKYYPCDIEVTKNTRAQNKEEVLDKIRKELLKIIK